MKARPLPHERSISVTAADQRYEAGGDQETIVHLLLAQINPTTIVLSALPESATAPDPLSKQTIFNLSVVAEEAISLTEIRPAGSRTYSLLTPRQTDILTRVCEGWSREEISESLDISVSSIDIHLVRIRERLHARTTTQAAVIAADLKLVHRHPTRHHYLDQARVTMMLTDAACVRITLTPLAQYIELGGEEKRVVAVGARGRVHVCQIRQPPQTGRSRDLALQLLRGEPAKDDDQRTQAAQSQRGKNTRRMRLLRELCGSPEGAVALQTVAAQMGLIHQHDVHAAAREWLAREIYVDDSRDAISPIFTTFNS